MLVIPARFNKNHPEVVARGAPADTGTWLIQYMCDRIGITDLGRCDVLDLGCGCRFADAIVNRQLPMKSYVGVDVDGEMVEFLSAKVADPRLSFFYWNAGNPNYNPNGQALSADRVLPIGNLKFDVICMFSVITHQQPADAEVILTILRRYIRATGHLFFSATVEEGDFGYKEAVPEAPAAHSIYSIALLRSIVERCGWKIVSLEGKSPGGLPIQDSFLCIPIAA
jgi:SAM-dependent methyltransferase